MLGFGKRRSLMRAGKHAIVMLLRGNSYIVYLFCEELSFRK